MNGIPPFMFVLCHRMSFTTLPSIHKNLLFELFDTGRRNVSTMNLRVYVMPMTCCPGASHFGRRCGCRNSSPTCTLSPSRRNLYPLIALPPKMPNKSMDATRYRSRLMLDVELHKRHGSCFIRWHYYTTRPQALPEVPPVATIKFCFCSPNFKIF